MGLTQHTADRVQQDRVSWPALQRLNSGLACLLRPAKRQKMLSALEKQPRRSDHLARFASRCSSSISVRSPEVSRMRSTIHNFSARNSVECFISTLRSLGNGTSYVESIRPGRGTKKTTHQPKKKASST